MTQSRLLSGCELQRMALIVIPGAQVDRVSFNPTLRHAQNVDKETETFLQLGRKYFYVSQMSHVHDRFTLHSLLPRSSLFKVHFGGRLKAVGITFPNRQSPEYQPSGVPLTGSLGSFPPRVPALVIRSGGPRAKSRLGRSADNSFCACAEQGRAAFIATLNPIPQ